MAVIHKPRISYEGLAVFFTVLTMFLLITAFYVIYAVEQSRF